MNLFVLFQSTDDTTQWRHAFNKVSKSVHWIEFPSKELEKAMENLRSLPIDTLFILGDAKWAGSVSKVFKNSHFEFRTIPTVFCSSKNQAPSELDNSIDDIITLQDISPLLLFRQKRSREKLVEHSFSEKRLKEKTNELAKLDTILKQREEFLSVCSHDLRSPLGVIQTAIGLVMAEKTLPAPAKELLDRAKRQATHALSLVKDLLDVTSYEQGLKPEYLILNLHTFLKSFHKDFDLQASQKKVGFHYDNSVPDWMVLADPDRMYQLLQNLVTNALKFTESGKNIFLKVTPFQGRRKSDPSFPMIIISIKDEGKGIPESELQKIFDKFTQLKESSRQGGRGLGLTVAKQISTLHDGNLWVESKQGQGSTFFVLLPHVLSLADKMPAPNQKRVLVVEPQEEKRLKNYQCLTEWGYELVFAKDGVEAVTLLHHIRPQAIILTRDLTKISSAEVSRLLKSTPVGQSTAIFLAVEKNQPILGNLEDKLLIDSKLVLPLEKHHWDACLAAHKSLKAA